MWRARASTGLPPCHDLVAGGGEFLCPEELWESNDAHKISRNDCGCHERRNRNGLPRAVALEQQRADASPSAARVHRLRRSGLAEEFPRMDVTVKDTKRFAASAAGATSISIIMSQKLRPPKSQNAATPATLAGAKKDEVWTQFYPLLDK